MKVETSFRSVEDIEGIGPSLGAVLREIGFGSIEGLLKFDPEITAKHLSNVSGISINQAINSYIPQARLLRVNGITPNFSEYLVSKGILDVEALAWLDSKTLLRYAAKCDIDINTVDINVLQNHALKLSGSNSLFFEIVNDEIEPIPYASIFIPMPEPGHFPYVKEVVTNELGFASIDFLPDTNLFCEIVAQGYARESFKLRNVKSSGRAFSIALSPGDVSVALVDEFRDGVSIFASKYPVQRVLWGPDEIPDGAVFDYLGESSEGSRLICAQYRLLNGYSEIYSTRVPRNDLPSSLTERQLLSYSKTANDWNILPDLNVEQWRIAEMGLEGEDNE